MVLLSFLVFFSFHCALILPPLEEVGTKVVDGWQCSVTLCVQANIPILAPQKSVVTPVPQEKERNCTLRGWAPAGQTTKDGCPRLGFVGREGQLGSARLLHPVAGLEGKQDGRRRRRHQRGSARRRLPPFRTTRLAFVICISLHK
jgi:hypothetical protein